jgi:thymidylate kinase
VLYVLSAIKGNDAYKKYASSKTTNPSFIKDYREQHHISVVVTREPGATGLVKKIRELLPDKASGVIFKHGLVK